MASLILRRLAFTLALPTVLVTIWWFASANSQSFFFPPLREIVDVLPGTWFHGRLIDDVVPSLLRLLSGYGLALVAGVVVGVVAGSSQTVRAVIEPPLEFMLILVAGIGDRMKILVIATGCLWPILLNTIEGVRGIEPVLRDVATSYRLSRWTRLRVLVLRGASPQVFTGARQALSIGLILMVISEMGPASNGLGYSTIQFQRSFAIPEMWSGILMLGVIGVLLSLVFRVVEQRSLRWYHGLRQSERKG
jgi:ABC-type nitrate/sulfonate/bicarbonate transport system permease component